LYLNFGSKLARKSGESWRRSWIKTFMTANADTLITEVFESRTAKLYALLRPSLVEMGYDIVHIGFEPRGKRQALVIMAETVEGASVTLTQCEEISRAVSALLDVEDAISEAYTLEITSAGIDRQLVRVRDFERARGFEIKVKFKTPQGERSKLRGTLKEINDNEVLILSDNRDITVALDNIRQARLVLTDDLIEATKKNKHPEPETEITKTHD